MLNFSFEGVYYQLLNSDKRTFQVGTHDTSVSPNAVVGKINKELHIIETKEIDDVIYTVERISQYAFRYCNSLHTVYLPDSIKSIEFRAFDLSSLKNLYFSPSSRLTEIGLGSLYDTKIKSLNIPLSLVNCSSFCLSIFTLRDIYYCGSYIFNETSFYGVTNNINLHLSSNNQLDKLKSFNIIKSDACSLPSILKKCTILKCRHQLSTSVVLFNALINY